MKANIPTAFLRSRSTLPLLSMLLLALTLTACSDPLSVSPDAESVVEADPGVQMYEVKINFKRIRVVGDCEADPIIVIKGRFAYRLSVSSQRPDGSWTDKSVVAETRNYGSKDGSVVTIASGNDININRTHTLVLPEGANYRMHMSAIEWDGSKKDHRMDGDTVTEENNTGGKLHYQHGLDLGPNTYCRVKLYVDADETRL